MLFIFVFVVLTILCCCYFAVNALIFCRYYSVDQRNQKMDRFVRKRPRIIDDGETSESNSESNSNIPNDADRAATCDGEHDDNEHASSETQNELPAPDTRNARSAYVEFPWLKSVSNGWLCSLCLQQYAEGKLFADIKRTGGTWVVTPFSKSKSRKLKEKSSQHGQSYMHRLALQKEHNQLGDIDAELSRQHICRDEATASMIKKLISSALYLFINEIPHTTQWPELLSLLALVVPEVEAWLVHRPANAHYMSATTVTQFLECAGVVVMNDVNEKVRNSISKYGAFSYMGDESTATSNHQFATHCVRYLDELGKPVETFFGFTELTQTTAEAIKTCVDDLFQRADIDINKMTSCSFDGGANYAGCHSGVQALLRKNNPALFYVHCRAHLLQLALVHASQKYAFIKRVLSVLNSLYAYFSRHPKKQRHLEEIEVALSGRSQKLVQPGKTRWLSYSKSIAVVLKQYSCILITLEHEHKTGGDLASEAGGLLLELRKHSTFSTMYYLDIVLQALAKLSQLFQSSCTTLQHAMSSAAGTITFMKEIDSKQVLNDATLHKPADLVDDLVSSQSLASDIDKFNVTVVANLEERLSKGLDKISKVMVALKDKDDIDFAGIAKVFQLDATVLAEEWKYVKRGPEAIDLCQLASCSRLRATFPSLSALAVRLLLLPVGTATCERSFSAMNRVLNAKRSSLTAIHLEQLLFITHEAPQIPHPRNTNSTTAETFDLFLTKVYKQYMSCNHRI